MDVRVIGPAVLAVAAAVIPGHLPTGQTVGTRTEMHNVQYRFDPSLAVHIRRLEGQLQRTRRDVPPTFDDKRSFSVIIESGEIAIDADSLTTLMNKYVFTRADSPVKNLHISMENGALKQTGTVHKGVELPFEMRAEVSATSEGLLRLHPASFKVVHVPVKGALHLLGLHLQDLIDPHGAPGVRLEKDDLILDPSQMLPPPAMRGRIAAATIECDKLVEFIGRRAAARNESRNYMRFRGGIIRFGKLTMHDADLSLIDAEPRDPFFFSLDRYKDQLVAGYSKTTPSFGLEVFMPDVTKLK